MAFLGQGANLLRIGSKNYGLLENKRRLNGSSTKGQDARSLLVEGLDQKLGRNGSGLIKAWKSKIKVLH
jgi:hypothetical protein